MKLRKPQVRLISLALTLVAIGVGSCHGPRPTGPQPLTDEELHARLLERVRQILQTSEEYALRILSTGEDFDTLSISGCTWPFFCPTLEVTIRSHDSIRTEMGAGGTGPGVRYHSSASYMLSDSTGKLPQPPGSTPSDFSSLETQSLGFDDRDMGKNWDRRSSVTFRHFHTPRVLMSLSFSATSRSHECHFLYCENLRLTVYRWFQRADALSDWAVLGDSTALYANFSEYAGPDSTGYPSSRTWYMTGKMDESRTVILEAKLDTVITVDTIYVAPVLPPLAID